MAKLERSHKYDDIIDLPRPISGRHARMPMIDRGAQFSAFAALTGYEAVLEETARLTDPRITLDENEKALLDEKLQSLAGRLPEQPEAVFLCFREDALKSGGCYTRIAGRVKKIDAVSRTVFLTDGRCFCIDDIYGIE